MKNMLKYGCGSEEEPEVTKLQIEYIQPDDCEGERDRVQRLILESVDNGCGPFIRMSIPQGTGDPGYWSFDDIKDLKKIVDDFYEKLNYKEE